MIVAENIALVRGRKTLFSEASFRFDRPEFVAIIGPNGAGKSSLLQLLSGAYAPSKGSVSIHGKPTGSWKTEELAKYRAYLQQQQSVFESFTVEDVLMMGRSIHFGTGPKQDDRSLVVQTLEKLDLTARREQPFNFLSGGEQQRVQFARTLLQLQETADSSLEGKVLFLDEPLNNLDLYYQYNLLQMARTDVVDKGGIVIAVLHDLNMAWRYADRVIILSEGRTIMDAPAQEALRADVLSVVYRMNIEKIEPSNQSPYFAVTGVPASGMHLYADKAAIRH
jgi:iron complex transport system ATP-binding protein